MRAEHEEDAVGIGRLVNRMETAVSDPAATLLLLGMLCLPVLAGCQDDTLAVVGTTASPPTQRLRAATWRVVVSGASPQIDAQVLDAVDADLVQRGIAIRIVTVAGQVDHVLDIRIGRAHRVAGIRVGTPVSPSGTRSRSGVRPTVIRFFDATETVREGRNSAFAIERIFATGAPGPAVPIDVAGDPVRSLAFQIGEQLEHPPPSAAVPAPSGD